MGQPGNAEAGLRFGKVVALLTGVKIQYQPCSDADDGRRPDPPHAAPGATIGTIGKKSDSLRRPERTVCASTCSTAASSDMLRTLAMIADSIRCASGLSNARSPASTHCCSTSSAKRLGSARISRSNAARSAGGRSLSQISCHPLIIGHETSQENLPSIQARKLRLRTRKSVTRTHSAVRPIGSAHFLIGKPATIALLNQPADIRRKLVTRHCFPEKCLVRRRFHFACRGLIRPFAPARTVKDSFARARKRCRFRANQIPRDGRCSQARKDFCGSHLEMFSGTRKRTFHMRYFIRHIRNRKPQSHKSTHHW